MATVRNAFALLQEERKILRQKEKKERAIQRKAEKQARLLREERKADVDQDYVSNEAAVVKKGHVLEHGASVTQHEAGTPTSSSQSPLRAEQKMNWADVTDDDESDSGSVANDVDELDRSVSVNNIRPLESDKNAADEDDGLAEFYSEDEEDEEDEDDEDDEDQSHYKDHDGCKNGSHAASHGKRGSLRPSHHANRTQTETQRSPAASGKTHRSAKSSSGARSDHLRTSSGQESITQSSASLSHLEPPAAVSGGGLLSPFSSSHSNKQLSKKDRQKLQEKELEALDALLDSFGLKSNVNPAEEGGDSTQTNTVGAQFQKDGSSINAVKPQEDASAGAEEGTSEDAPSKVLKNKKKKKTVSTSAQGTLPTGAVDGSTSEQPEHGERTTIGNDALNPALSPKAIAAAARRAAAAAASGSKKKSKSTGGVPVPDAVLAEAKIKSEMKKAKQKRDKHMFDR